MKEFINKIDISSYNLLFVKAAHHAPVRFIEEISNAFCKIPKISYHWNSIKLYNYLEYIKYFDKNYSFDPDDCQCYSLKYYPLFFIDEYSKAREEISKSPKDIDIIFIHRVFQEADMIF